MTNDHFFCFRHFKTRIHRLPRQLLIVITMMNEKFHPVPWSALDYVEGEDSYVVPFTKEQLQAAPADSLDKLTRNDGAQSYATRANDYYKIQH